MAQVIRPTPRRRFMVVASVGIATLLMTAAASQASRFMRIGKLWDEYGSAGNEAWGGTCMVWPGGFWTQDYGPTFSYESASYRGFLYGVMNYTVPPDPNSWAMPTPQAPGTVDPYYVVQRDIANTPSANSYQLINGIEKIIYQSPLTVVTTDGVVNTPVQAADGIDPSLPTDAEIITSWRNNMGLQTTRYIYASANPLYSSFHIWHYSYKNTGKYCCSSQTIQNGDPNAQYDQTLSNLYFSHSLWFMDRGIGGQYTASMAENTGDGLLNYKGNNDTTYAREDVVSDTKIVYGNKIGMDLTEGGKYPVVDYGQLRVMYGWDGDSPTYPGNDCGDPRADNGQMLSARWPGIGLIHADVSTTDRTDDPEQPRRMVEDNIVNMPRIDVDGMEVTYKSMQWPGGYLNADTSRFDEDAIRKGVPYGAGADLKYIGPNTVFSVGGDNWDIPPGDSVNTIWVSAVGGIPYQETLKLGQEWIAGGKTGVAEQDRLAKYYSLEDSLFTLIKRAQDAVGVETSQRGDLETKIAANIGTVPPNPATFTVKSGGNRVDLSWTPPASGTIDGYHLYRATGSRDGDRPWSLVYSGTATSFKDTTGNDPAGVAPVQVGGEYFYYLTSVKNGLESSPWIARTSKAVIPVVSPKQTTIADSVFVVPNPYDTRYMQEKFTTGPGQPLPTFAQKVTFYGLTSTADIYIYTLEGTLIRSIHHEATGSQPQSGIEAWDLLTDNGLPVVSGVYIYVVKGSDGKKVVGKIVVVR